jgi:hypothetical protein
MIYRIQRLVLFHRVPKKSLDGTKKTCYSRAHKRKRQGSSVGRAQH